MMACNVGDRGFLVKSGLVLALVLAAVHFVMAWAQVPLDSFWLWFTFADPRQPVVGGPTVPFISTAVDVVGASAVANETLLSA